MTDFPMLLKALTDQPIGDRYYPVYLAIGFLSGALTDDGVREDLLAYGTAEKFHLERLRSLANSLQAIIAKADHASA